MCLRLPPRPRVPAELPPALAWTPGDRRKLFWGCGGKNSVELEGWRERPLLAFEAGRTRDTVNVRQETLPDFGGKDDAVFL